MLRQESASYGFAELEVLADYIVSSQTVTPHTSSYSLLKINNKIRRNSLQEYQKYIVMGLTSIYTIDDYLNRHPDTALSVKLTNIMANEYKELKKQSKGYLEIFDDMWNFASGNRMDYLYKAAGLGILTYFFEKCEVFEK